MKKIDLRIRRKAIAMIELIFAIVIIGIVLLSVPNLISTATKSGYVSLQQEAIATISSQMGLLFTKHWDENNVIDATTGIDDTVILKVTNGSASLASRSGARDRSFNLPSGGQVFATDIGSELNDFDDIDDFTGTSMTLRNFSDTEVTEGDIIDTNILITTIIDYTDDNTSSTSDYNDSNTIQYNFSASSAPATSNIKSISVELTTNNPAEELEKNILLHAFTANIGSYLPERRVK